MSLDKEKTERCIDEFADALADDSVERNWREDYLHENGRYVCSCIRCNKYFIGHKRRVICKECASK